MLCAGTVQFFVNNVFAGQVEWALGLTAYPAMSCENGVVNCNIHRM